MRDFIIITDSTSDLNKQVRSQYNIDYVKMNIVVNQKEMPASLDWDLYSPKELYDWMRNGTRIFTTQVPQEEYETVFKKHLDEGKDILYIACSSALSGSYNISKTVRDELLEKYSDAKIICIDSLIACLGQGSLVIDAATLKNEGKTIDEVATFVEKNKLNYNQFATVESLQYLKNAGRVKASAAFFGNILGVKPIIISDAKGQNFAMKKVKGRRASIIELVTLAKQAGVNLENQTAYIGHADCLEDAMFLQELVKKELNPKDISVDYIGPIIGATTGPGTIAVYVVGKTVEIVGQ